MKREYRYGFICAAGLSLWVLIEFALGFHTTSFDIGRYSGYLSFVVPVIVIFIALMEEQSITHHRISLKAGVNTGFQIAIISAVLFTLFMVIYNAYINPHWIDSLIEWQRRQLILGGATNDDIERFVEQNRRMNNAFGQGIMNFMGTTGIGVVITLIEIPIVRMLGKKG